MSILQNYLTNSFSSKSIKRYKKKVLLINQLLESKVKALTDEQLDLTYQETKDPLMCIALMSEAIYRTKGLRAFDTQLMCALALYEGRLAEMKTGEGKTLAVGLGAAALAKKGKVHVLTANEYLAKRDARDLAPAYNLLNISVSICVSELNSEQKKVVYRCDVLYSTSSEVGFDYLRDNTAITLSQQVQSSLDSVIIDEADFMLIDEARTPLVLSQQAPTEAGPYMFMWDVVKSLPEDKVELEPKQRRAYLTTDGAAVIENELVKRTLLKDPMDLYKTENLYWLNVLQACLEAKFCWEKDIDYVILKGEVQIVDSGTGRIMEGRRWSDGLHSAIEAKESVEIKNETKTLASITIQSYLRKYKHLCGLTGTAATEAVEFSETYGLETVVIPTRRPVIRVDHPFKLFVTRQEKLRSAAQKIKECIQKGQPVLVGCESVEESEMFSKYLKELGIEHQTLNAKDHAKEALMIARAGTPGCVTVTTQMAGRGTDILLGGEGCEPEIKKQVQNAGGLFVLSTCANESRRSDNQLKGRAGRQGDPGESQRFISLEDNLAKRFGGEKIQKALEKQGDLSGQEIDIGILRNFVDSWQRACEAAGYDSRKQIAKFDEAFTLQRDSVYSLRQQLMKFETPVDYLASLATEGIQHLMTTHPNWDGFSPDWEFFEAYIHEKTGVALLFTQWFEGYEGDKYFEKIYDHMLVMCEMLKQPLSFRLLQLIDIHWKDYLTYLESVKTNIHLRAFAQKNPLYEFKKEAKEAFEGLRLQLAVDLITNLVMEQTPEDSDEIASEDFVEMISPQA